MIDLIINSISAVTVAVLGFFYIKGGNPRIFDKLIKTFISKNPKLFGRSSEISQ